MSRGPSLCRILKDEIVAKLFPVIYEIGFARDDHPLRWFGWDVSTRRYIWEFRRAPNSEESDLLSIDLVCDYLMVQVNLARISNEPQPNAAGTISPSAELGAAGAPRSLRKQLIRQGRLFGLLDGSYSMRAKKDDRLANEKRAKALVSELCADMEYVRAYFDGSNTKGRVR
jgi:hypothetical protein